MNAYLCCLLWLCLTPLGFQTRQISSYAHCFVIADPLGSCRFVLGGGGKPAEQSNIEVCPGGRILEVVNHILVLQCGLKRVHETRIWSCGWPCWRRGSFSCVFGVLNNGSDIMVDAQWEMLMVHLFYLCFWLGGVDREDGTRQRLILPPDGGEFYFPTVVNSTSRRR